MQKRIASVLALTGWFAVTAQWYLMIRDTPLPLGEVLIRFFSYFTILANILVALSFTMFAVQNENKPSFFTRPGVVTAITVYILVVGMIYNLVLRFLWSPRGIQQLVDELLHSAIPLLTILYWLKYVPKKMLQYKDCLAWMWFPFAYIVLIAVRGAVSAYYPYPFVNVTKLGYPRVLLNGLGMVLLFMGLGLFLTAVAKWISRRQPATHRKT